MDTSAPISFNQAGVCNYCLSYDNNEALIEKTQCYSSDKLHQKINSIKKQGKKSAYDCILGVSGGVDSSYLCHLLREWEIRPLLVHFDNGWNSELSIHNIQTLVEKTGFDLFTYVTDWEEFRELQKAYFRASVIDVEVLTDHAFMATLFRKANEFNVKTVVIGQNRTTEFAMPDGWNFTKWDLVNIKAICDRFSSVSIQKTPIYGAFSSYSKDINYFEPLQYVEYHKERCQQLLEREYGWRRYEGKHYESIFTKFYQAYYLPEKFGIDKRKVHLSNLIWSGQITREEALEEIAKSLYTPQELEVEKKFVLEKLGFSEREWDAIMHAPPVPHAAYDCSPLALYMGVNVRISRQQSSHSVDDKSR